jgi:DNA-binding NarL/FixJ family response regulator
MGSMIRIMIVDPDGKRRMRRAKALHFHRDVKVVGLGADILEAWESNLYSTEVEVILITLDRINEQVISDWAMIRILLPQPGIIALVYEHNVSAIELALGVGVMGLHDMDVEPSLLCRAVCNVARGETDYDPLLLTRILELMLKKSPIKNY